MSIITTEIKTDRKPSKLEKSLEEFRFLKTGDIILTPEQAKEKLFKALLSHYRAHVDRHTPIVEVLAHIAGELEGERCNFTKALKEFEKKQAEIARQGREREEVLGTILPRPPVREI